MSIQVSGSEAQERRYRFNRILFQWCLERSERAIESSRQEDAARWLLVAAKCADTFGCGELTSARLESLTLRLALNLPCATTPSTTTNVTRWLHVMTEALPIGGHTALVRRWITNDTSGDIHHLVLTNMEALSIPELAKAIQSSGGTVTTLGNIPSYLERAQSLRQLAYAIADRIVLHIHMWDIVAPIAFGVAGGPPVIYLNHADHVFWVGSSVADQVANIRQSGVAFCVSYRGITRNALLPIPLECDESSISSNIGARLRDALRIPNDATVFLTIGTEFKYQAVGELDFLASARKLLNADPTAYLIAVGPKPTTPGWLEATHALAPRLITVGKQRDLHPYHAAADVYLEGFPFGSLTALLEAALANLPCVRAPRSAPPPFTSDGSALDGFAQPDNLDAYIAEAVSLASSAESRSKIATTLRFSVRSYHCGDAWRTHLERFKQALPATHQLHPVFPKSLPQEVDRYWGDFLLRCNPQNALEFMILLASSLDLRPSVDRYLALAATRGQIDLYKPHRHPMTWWILGKLLRDIPMGNFISTRSSHKSLLYSFIEYMFSKHIKWRFKK